MKSTDGLFASDKPVVGIRCVHLDLKGTPPTPERLIKLLKVFVAARYNSVLVEWEDSFPWTVDARFRSETAYSPVVVRKFAKAADDLGMELIPLVQCLGHMETPLRLDDYGHLREVSHDESALNPLARGARGLIERMVDDVLALMPKVKRFHLGGDEAWTFGSHPDTKKYIAKHGKGALYLRHVEPLLDRLIKRHIRPLLWHDMMRDWDAAALKRLGRKADLVVWGYGGHPYTMGKHCNQEMIERFNKHNIPLWGGAAYKGADGIDADLPNISVREKNALGWAEAARDYSFIGVIATAWSRYSTNVVQNEPIDGTLDSAFNIGVILHDGRPPAGGIEACRRELVRIGEGPAFGRTRKALLKLSEARSGAWYGIKLLRHLVVTVTCDSRRLPCSGMVNRLNITRKQIESAEAAAGDLRKALNGLMESIWVERYIAERLEPLREEFAALDARIRQLSPVAYSKSI
jgi:hexosaminidase